MQGAAGASGGEETPTTPEEPMDLGVGDGSDVVTIGDSWMSYALNRGGIEGALERAGKDYRNYAVAGTTLGGSIPGQYDRAKSSDPNISTVIMTGGGNDIMFSGACNTSAGCEEAIRMLVENLDALWTTMADDGVSDIVYIAYAEDAGTTPQSTRPEGEAPVPSICLTGRIRCHSLETTDLVMGSLVDGIHPTSSANDRIAEALLQLMEDEGIRR
jgi:lysophospholipase L1-like esterase